MKKTITTEELLQYLQELEKNPTEKERFNRSVRRAAERERRKDGGEFTAMFLDAIRIP